MSSYRSEFRAALLPFAASLLGRLTYSAQPLILFGVLYEGTGTFAAAGSLAGLFGLVCAFAGPLRARFIDRHGARRVMTLLGIGYAVSMAAPASAVEIGAPTWTYWPLVVVAGLFAPPMGILMRVLWADLVHPDHLARALGLDAAAEEVIYVVGPLLSGLILAACPPAPALVGAATVMAAACVLLGRSAHHATLARSAASQAEPHSHENIRTSAETRPEQSSTTPGNAMTAEETRTQENTTTPGATTSPGNTGSPVPSGSLREVLVALVPALLPVTASGVAISMVWLAVVALPGTSRLPGGAGSMLTLLALGSAAGALVHGRLAVAVERVRRLHTCAFAMAGVLAVLGALPYPWVWAAGLPILGAFTAPVMVNAYLLAGRTTARLRAQANAYTSTVLNAATAVGGAAAGVLVDGAGPGATVLAAAAVAVPLTALGTLTAARSRRATDATDRIDKEVHLTHQP